MPQQGVTDQLILLKEQYDKGLLSKKEFYAAIRKLLDETV